MKGLFSLLLLPALILTLWAGEGAVVFPTKDVTATSKTDNPTTATDAITIPRMLSYQGKLTDDQGNPVPNGDYQLTFRLYPQETGGNPFWSETQTVRVEGGLFSVLLGRTNPIPSIPENGAIWLSLQVGSNPELSPRLRIVSSPYSFISERSAQADSAIGAQRVGGYDLTGLDGRYVNENQANSITSSMIVDRTILGQDLNQMGAGTGQVLKWSGSNWVPGNDEVGGDNAWVRGTPDSVLYTIRQLGIARGGADNMLYGIYRFTHINLGVACTTGTSGQDYEYCTVGGGYGNKALGAYATVGGGWRNTASGFLATVGGGYRDTASGSHATVGGGEGNTASGYSAFVGGGVGNTASGYGAFVGGGWYNTASGNRATVGGGWYNTASGVRTTVGGGYADTAAADYSFAVGNHSIVPAGCNNSAAFNGTTATGPNQVRCYEVVQGSDVFAIDHPLDPYGKILNHYGIAGPEMRYIYEGNVILDANGRAEVKLPDYFSVLLRNPHIQLTGVGTSDVYVAEKISGNRFVIGGKPGTEVYWQVTGERTDVTAEVTRRLLPVEQLKTGPLTGIMLDDEGLVGCMEQLEREGKASGINFRTAEGRRRYEEMKNPPKVKEENK